MKNKLAYVLLADLVASRQVSDRPAFEGKLQGVLSSVSKTFENAFAPPLQVWKGLDEMAAVLKTPVELYNIISVIQSAVAPQKFRFVLVQGNIDLVPANRDVREADGPAFHQAAEAMQQLKRDGVLFFCKTGNTLWDAAYSNQVNLLLLQKGAWTLRQQLIYDAYIKSGRQEQVAEVLSITQQTVSKTLQSIGAAKVQLLETRFTAWTKESLNE